MGSNKDEAYKLMKETEHFVKKMDETEWDPSMRSNEVSFAFEKAHTAVEELVRALSARCY